MVGIHKMLRTYITIVNMHLKSLSPGTKFVVALEIRTENAASDMRISKGIVLKL